MSRLLLSGQNILVTGAGGSLGSALIKALCDASPRSLILLDASEKNLFEIQRHLEAGQPECLWPAILGSVTDGALLDELFARYRPSIVFHAAAVKHVALLESNPFAAVTHNVLGTYALAQAARSCGSSLLLISTDKAARPASVMGATKRIAELIAVSLSTPECPMNALRLGNVTGSSGSVVPIFRQQIGEGGPVTITDPGASRYFLTIHEAVAAILSAATSGCEGAILLPEMAAPVRIGDLAQSLIAEQVNGSAREIPILYIGLRPGEKLTEDLIGPRDALRLARCEIDSIVKRLEACISTRDVAALVETLVSIVPDYVPSCAVKG